ncbi:hypothetical protein GCM10028807_21240 [Spirosoma daeguense]
MKHPLLDRLATITVVLLFLLAYIPLLVLSLHNHPSPADDFCFADTTLRYGFWSAQNYYYNGWTGRYFSNMLVHGSPLVWGWYDGYRFIPALMVTALLLVLYGFVNEMLRTESLKTKLIATATLFFLMILAMSSTVEAFFWTAAIATYTVPTILTIYLLTVISRWYRLPNGPIRILTAIWAGFLVFASIGSGETNLILLLLLLLSIAGYRLLFLRTFDPLLAWLVLVAFVSAWLLFRAPGNAIRMGGNPHSGEIVTSMVSSFKWLARWVATWLVKTPILPLSILYLPIARRLVRSGSPIRELFMLPTGLLTLIYIGILAATIFPSYYGIGIPPFDRTMNVLFIFFTLGWFYTLTVWIGWFERRGRLPAIQVGSVALLVVAGVWIAGSIWFSKSLTQLYKDWLSGNAATFDREMTVRHEKLIQPSDTLRLGPISVYPPSLFIEDIKPEQKHWWNRCHAGYYNHKIIILDSTLTATAHR